MFTWLILTLKRALVPENKIIFWFILWLVFLFFISFCLFWKVMSSLLSWCQMHYILLEYDVWHATKDHKSFLIFQIAENRYKISCKNDSWHWSVCSNIGSNSYEDNWPDNISNSCLRMLSWCLFTSDWNLCVHILGMRS